MKRTIAIIVMAMFVLTQGAPAFATQNLRNESAEGKGIGKAQAELRAAEPAAATGDVLAAQQRIQDGVAVVISQDPAIDLSRIKQNVKPFEVEFKDVVRVSTVEEIEKITNPIVVILNYPGNTLTEGIISYAEKNKIQIIDMSGKELNKVKKEVEQAV